MTDNELIRWALFGAGVGRLLARDTITKAPRDKLLKRVASPTLAEGVECPSCVGWHAIFWARVVMDRRGFWSSRWWRDQMAAWALAAVITRKGG